MSPVPSSNGKQSQPSAEEDQLAPLGGVNLMTGDVRPMIDRNRKYLLLLLSSIIYKTKTCGGPYTIFASQQSAVFEAPYQTNLSHFGSKSNK